MQDEVFVNESKDAALSDVLPIEEDTLDAVGKEEKEFNLADDLKELAIEFPRLGGEGAEALFDTARYKELRELGLSSKEAFLATSKRTAERKDTLSHLGGSVPKRARPLDTGMTQAEMRSAREIFTGMSDEEIRALYRRVKN